MRTERWVWSSVVAVVCSACGCQPAVDATVDSTVLPLAEPVETPQEPAVDPSEEGTDALVTIRPTSDYGEFPGRIEHLGRALLRNGVGLCEWGVFGFDLYRGALYVERRSSDPETLLAADQVSVVHLHFLRSLSETQLGDAFTASVTVNAGEDAPRYGGALERLNGSLGDVDAGDSLTFTSVPGRGLIVQRDGAVVADIVDESFRRLFLRLYLGEKPPTTALRAGMLGDW